MKTLTFLFLVVIDCLWALIQRVHVARLRLDGTDPDTVHAPTTIRAEFLNKALWERATLAMRADIAPNPGAPRQPSNADDIRPTELTIERIALLIAADAAEFPRTWEAFENRFGVQGWAGSVALIRLARRGAIVIDSVGIRANPEGLRRAD